MMEKKITSDYFLSCFSKDTIFNDRVYLSIYAFLKYNPNLAPSVTRKLISLGRIDVVKNYNAWLKVGDRSQATELIKVIEDGWYIKELNEARGILKGMEAESDCLTKKKLLLEKKLKLLKGK